MTSPKALLLAIAAAAALLGTAATKAEAVNTLSATYYSVAPGDADFQSYCCGTFNNQVTGTLGPDGLPVFNPAYGGPTIHDVNSSGEITWWSPALNHHVTLSGTGQSPCPTATLRSILRLGMGRATRTPFRPPCSPEC